MLVDMKMSSAKPSQFIWSHALPKVMFNMNTDFHSNLKTSAFDFVFGQASNTGKKKVITELDNSSVSDTFDSYDRAVKKFRKQLKTTSMEVSFDFTIDTYDCIVKREERYLNRNEEDQYDYSVQDYLE